MTAPTPTAHAFSHIVARTSYFAIENHFINISLYIFLDRNIKDKVKKGGILKGMYQYLYVKRNHTDIYF